MSFNDVAVYSVTGGFFLLVLAGLIYSFVGKKKGYWDERSRVRGELRQRGWKSLETVSSIAKHFAVSDRYSQLDRALIPDIPGLMVVEGKSGEVEWKTAVTISPDDGAHLLVCGNLAQLQDGSVGSMPEVRLDRLDDGFAVFSSHGQASWKADGSTHGSIPSFVNHDLLDCLYRWTDAEAVHFAGEQVTARLTSQASQRDLVELVDESSRKIGTIIGLLGPTAWA